MPVNMAKIEPFYEVFGYRLRKGRRERGLTLEDVGKLIKQAPGYVSDVESGRRRVPLHVAAALAAALGLGLSELTAPSAGHARLEALADE